MFQEVYSIIAGLFYISFRMPMDEKQRSNCRGADGKTSFQCSVWKKPGIFAFLVHYELIEKSCIVCAKEVRLHKDNCHGMTICEACSRECRSRAHSRNLICSSQKNCEVLGRFDKFPCPACRLARFISKNSLHCRKT